MLSISIDEIITAIEDAGDVEINQILDAITRRYNRVFPDWEVLFLSVPRDPEKKVSQLEQMLCQLRNGDLI